MGNKACTKCTRTDVDFPKGRNVCKLCKKKQHDEWVTNNSEYMQAYMKAYRAAPERKAARNAQLAETRRTDIHTRERAIEVSWKARLTATGLTQKQYDQMLEVQNHKCAICHQPETRIRLGRVTRLAIDHSHITGKVRKLLCMKCNAAIGLVHESTELLEAAKAYLIRHRS
jgi:hypothetical protein